MLSYRISRLALTCVAHGQLEVRGLSSGLWELAQTRSLVTFSGIWQAPDITLVTHETDQGWNSYAMGNVKSHQPKVHFPRNLVMKHHSAQGRLGMRVERKHGAMALCQKPPSQGLEWAQAALQLLWTLSCLCQVPAFGASGSSVGEQSVQHHR